MIQKGTIFKFFKKNLILMFLIVVFLIFFKISTSFCLPREEQFLKSIFINGCENLVTEKVTLTQAINSQNNFIKLWKPPVDFNLLFFIQSDNTFFINKHPLSHPHILLFKDDLNELFWTFQLSHNPPYNLKHNFSLLSDSDIYNKKNFQFIWKKPGLISYIDVKILSSNFISNNLKQEVRTHVMKTVINQKLNFNFICNLTNN